MAFSISSFWVDPALGNLANAVIQTIGEKWSQIKQVDNPTDGNTLIITSKESVFREFGSNLTLATPEYLLDNLESIPKKGIQRVSDCLEDIHIVLTGLSSKTKKRAFALITLLGGECMNSLNEQTDLVISNSMKSQVAFMAGNKGIPIVEAEWLEECWNIEERVQFDEFLLRRFQGLVFSSSELTCTQRLKIIQQIESLGGKWSDTLHFEVSILIAPELSPTKKILLAIEKCIPIVRPEWLFRKQLFGDFFGEVVMNWWCFKEEQRTLFDKKTFGIDPDLKDKKLITDAIFFHGGTYSKNPDYFITDLGRIVQEETTSVNQNWLWHCVSTKSLVDPLDSPFFEPIGIQVPLEEAKGKVLISALSPDWMRLIVSTLLREIGYTIVYTPTKKADAIVSDQCDVSQYGIPVLNTQWVIELLRTGVVQHSETEVSTLSGNSTLRRCCQKIEATNAANVTVRPINIETIGITEFSQTPTQRPHFGPMKVELMADPITTLEISKNEPDPLIALLSGF